MLASNVRKFALDVGARLLECGRSADGLLPLQPQQLDSISGFNRISCSPGKRRHAAALHMCFPPQPVRKDNREKSPGAYQKNNLWRRLKFSSCIHRGVVDIIPLQGRKAACKSPGLDQTQFGVARKYALSEGERTHRYSLCNMPGGAGMGNPAWGKLVTFRLRRNTSTNWVNQVHQLQHFYLFMYKYVPVRHRKLLETMKAQTECLLARRLLIHDSV